MGRRWLTGLGISTVGDGSYKWLTVFLIGPLDSMDIYAVR